MRVESTMLLNLMYLGILNSNDELDNSTRTQFLPLPNEDLYYHALMLMPDVKRGRYKKDKWFLQLDHAHEKYLTLRPR